MDTKLEVAKKERSEEIRLWRGLPPKPKPMTGGEIARYGCGYSCSRLKCTCWFPKTPKPRTIDPKIAKNMMIYYLSKYVLNSLNAPIQVFSNPTKSQQNLPQTNLGSDSQKLALRMNIKFRLQTWQINRLLSGLMILFIIL